MSTRRLIRYFAALLAAATAVIYFLIGFQLIPVIEPPSDQVFGLFAGLAYTLGVILLLMFDRRVFWFVGSLFQVFVIGMYFNMAAQRVPTYESWGILLRVIQVILLMALVFLALREPEEEKVQRRATA
jgi:membrane-anchored protein YejM (alkaline phosphatase superfamily)